jgi:hypothetical protein
MANQKRGRGESKTSVRRVKAVERQVMALEMRRDGKTYQQIADVLDYAGPSSAWRAVQAALQKVIEPAVHEYRRLEDSRLDALLQAVWPAAMVGDLASVDRALRICESRRRLLGLDGRAKIDVTTDGQPLETHTVDYMELSDEQLRTILSRRSGAGAGSPDAGQAELD